MKNKKGIVLFVNDSYFSYLLAKDLINCNHNEIAKVVFSISTSSSLRKIFTIYKKVYKKYFLYRISVQLLTKLFYKKKSVEYLVKKYNIEYCHIKNIQELKNKVDNYSLGFAFNFDLILKDNILSKFKNGIFNIHASRLPQDKGISPVLWAFARGDNEIWSTRYKMDSGIDSGPILTQFQIPILTNDSAFSVYKRVCIESGKVFNNNFELLLNNKLVLSKQEEILNPTYFSWPNKIFSSMIKKSKRKLMNFKDVLLINEPK